MQIETISQRLQIQHFTFQLFCGFPKLI